MFTRLPESNATRQRRLGGAIVSTVVHLVFIALAVRATGLKAAPAPKVTPVAIFIAPVAKPPAPSTDRRIAPRSSSGSPSVPLPPAPKLPDIGDIVPVIPDPGTEIDLTRRGDFGPTNSTSVADRGTGGAPNVSNGSPMRADVVDKTILALPGTSTPRYPSMLQSAGVEGDVRAQFVVDTLGRVEQGSVRILDTSHALFATAVRDALGRARFQAAEAGGRKVRQLAEQVFTFRITR